MDSGCYPWIWHTVFHGENSYSHHHASYSSNLSARPVRMRELLDSLPHSIKFYAYHDTRFFRPLTTVPRSTPTPSMASSLPPLDASSNVMTCGVWPRGSRHLSFPIRASVARLHLLKTFGWRRSRFRKYRTTTNLEDTIQLIGLFYPFTAVVARCIYLGNWERTLRLCCMNLVRSRRQQTCYPH